MDIGIHQSTACKNIWQTCKKIIAKSNEIIQFPSTPEEFQTAVREWQRTREPTIPNCFGVLDCTHIEILKPRAFGNVFINRKGYPSFNTLAVCNSNYKFIYVDCRFPGSVHDSRVYRESKIFDVLHDNQTNRHAALVLADTGFPITPATIVPFKDVLNRQQHHFNQFLRADRIIIEHAFGQMKKRFPMMMNAVRVKLQRIPSFILACCILHNIAKDLGEPDFESQQHIEIAPENVQHDDVVDDDQQNVIFDRNIHQAGLMRRENMMNALFPLAD